MNPVIPVSGEPLALLAEWLPDNDDADRPQIQLATVDLDGGTDVRTVLMTSWSADGFRFHTDSRSRKVAQLVAEPRCSFALVWPGFTRQLVVAARAEIADPADLAAAYARRSPYLRRLAWVNSHETAQLEREARVEEWSRSEAAQPDAALEAPATWTGFLLRPSRLTFWHSDPEAPSHRTEYRSDTSGWVPSHLAG